MIRRSVSTNEIVALIILIVAAATAPRQMTFERCVQDETRIRRPRIVHAEYAAIVYDGDAFYGKVWVDNDRCKWTYTIGGQR